MARWKKYTIGAGAGILGLLLFLLLLGPLIVSSVMERRLRSSLEEQTTGRVEIADVDFSWFGATEVEGLVLRDRHGEVILHAPRSTIEGSIWNGYSDVLIHIDRPAALVRRHEDGTWNWKEIRRPQERGTPRDGTARERSDRRARLLVTGARITLVSGANRSELLANGSGVYEGGDFRYDATGEGLRLSGDLDDVSIEATQFEIAKLRGLWNLPDLRANGHAQFHIGDAIRGTGKFDLGQAGLRFELGRDILIDGFAQLEPLRAGWKGRAEGTIRLDGRRATGRVTVTDFEASGVSDPRVTIEADADVVRQPLDVVIHDAKVSSSFLRSEARGRVQNQTVLLEGDLWYVPSKVDAVFDLPGELLGTDEQKVSFAFESPLRPRDLLDFLRGTLARGTFGLGKWESNGFAIRGKVDSELRDGQLRLNGGLDVNGGRAEASARADFRGNENRYAMNATFHNVVLDPAMSDFLQFLHPLFLAETGLAGSVQGSVELSFAGPFAKEKLNGRGSFQFTDVVFREAPILEELTALIDFDRIQMEPLIFTLREGRVSYDRPLRMRISGQMTTWTGSIGLDQSLDLTWEIPIGEKLIRRYPVLQRIAGEPVRIPVRGTVTSPQVQWQRSIEELVGRVAERELENRADDWLGDVLGSRNEEAAKKLLADADNLYAEGNKADAAALYAQIREKHGKTRTYKENKDRIKQRMNER